MKLKNYYLIFCLFSFQTSFGQTWKDTLSLINKSFSNYKPENPGCQLAISRNGELVFSKAWGIADLEHNVVLSDSSIFEAGSISKQFVAAAILLLQQRRKLSLDDNVRKYIPELPDYKTTITIRHLLHHTSGLRDWGDIVSLTGWSRTQKFYTNQDVLEITARQKQLNFKPGNEYLYSNTNYCLLAVIVERVSGLSLPFFTQKYIFEQAGMTHTQWRDDPKRIVINRAIAYSKAGGSYKTNMPNEYVYGPGGLLTTAEDLLKWNHFYEAGRIGNPSILSEQIHTDTLNNGAMNNYAAGLFINKIMGWKNISYDGATASYRAYLEMFPELHSSISLLSNTSEFGITDMENKIRNIFVSAKTADSKFDEIKSQEKPDNKISFKLPQVYLKNLAGTYVNEMTRSTFNLSINKDTLLFNNYLPLVPISNENFRSDNILIKLNSEKGLFITLSPGDTVHISKVKPVDVIKEFTVYEGNYFSEETNSYLKIENKNNKLMIRLNANKEFQLVPIFKDEFRIDELDCDMQFIRSAKNKISAIKFYFQRTRGVEFKNMNNASHI